MIERPVVLYHADCPDGFTAAYVAKKRYPAATLLAVRYGDPLPDAVDGRDVLVVDFSYPRDVTEDLARRARSLLVLDHHKTAEEALRGLPYATFDMSRSGAGLAWDVLFEGERRPRLVDYVEDRDLWRHRMPSTHEVAAYVATVPFHLPAWASLEKTLEEAPWYAIFGGEALLRGRDKYVEDMCSHARVVPFMGYADIPVVNAPPYAVSDLVGKLAEGRPFAVGWFVEGSGRVKLSFRSRDGGVDVSELAKKLGGGGHRNAAGATVDGLDVGDLVLRGRS